MSENNQAAKDLIDALNLGKRRISDRLSGDGRRFSTAQRLYEQQFLAGQRPDERAFLGSMPSIPSHNAVTSFESSKHIERSGTGSYEGLIFRAYCRECFVWRRVPMLRSSTEELPLSEFAVEKDPGASHYRIICLTCRREIKLDTGEWYYSNVHCSKCQRITLMIRIVAVKDRRTRWVCVGCGRKSEIRF